MDRNAQKTVLALAGGLAHQIKTPLSTLLMNLQLIRENLQQPPAPTERERQVLEKIRLLEKEVFRLGETLNEFLRFVGGKPADLKPGSINLLVAELLDFFEPEAQAKSIRIHRALDYRIPLFPIDFEMIRQAVMAVLKNAVEAMAGGGDLYAETLQEGPDVLVSVTNTGTPLPEEQRRRVFDVYYSTKPEGSGLGLAAARRALEEHGGTVELSTEPSWGTRFVLRLPLETGPEAGAPGRRRRR